MNRNFRKWLACAVAVTIAVYNAPYSVEALEVIKDSVQVDSATSPEGEQNVDVPQTEDDGVQSDDKVDTVPEDDASDEVVEDMPTEANAGTFIVSGNEGTDWSYSDNVLTINATATDITIKGNGSITGERIVVASGFTGTITLNGVNIETSAGAPFLIENGANPTIKIKVETSSSFKTSDIDRAGIELNGENANITINEKEGEWGVLTATSSNDQAGGAGIGSGNGANCGNITISGGIVEARARMGAGIGSGNGANCGNIEINGGDVIARSSKGAVIGSGNGASCGNITISGGIVKATSEAGAGIDSGNGAGIGSGSGNGANCGNITISGGNVMARSEHGVGIGSGNEANCGDIEINGGTVTATGGAMGNSNKPGIGGDSVSAVVISGGSVKSINYKGEESISPSPKNKKEDGENVYLVKLDNQGDFKEGDTVKVVGQTGSGKKIDKNYNVASNHEGADSFYLYMPAGTYTITTHKGVYRVTVNNDGSVNIHKKESDTFTTEFEVRDSKYGDQISNILTKATLASGRDVKYLYSTSETGEYKEREPIDVGRYYVKAVAEEDDKYLRVESGAKLFTISKAENEWTTKLSINGWKYGGTANNPSAIAKFGKVEFTYSDTKEGIYKPNVPTDAGTYYVKATVEGTENYTGLESKDSFEIKKATGSIEFKDGAKLDKIYDGNAVAITDNHIEKSDSTGAVTFTFEKKVNDKWETVTEAPSEAGRYRVKASLAEDNNYTSAESKYLYFTIYKAPEITEENENVDTSTDRIEINTETENKGVYLYCTDSKDVPRPPKTSTLSIESVEVGVKTWQEVTGSKIIFTGLNQNTTYHVWKYDNSKPDGEKLTYIYSIKTDSPSIPSIPSKPEEKPDTGVDVEVVDKIAGENRYDTSVSISQKVYPSKSEKVYLVSGEKFPDALSSAALTGKGDGPILLINDKNIDKILSEIDRLDAKEIVFIGGNSISDVNEAKIRKFAKENSSVVKSIVGKDRYETAVKVAEETISKYGNKGKVIIADGRNYPDAVSIASYAAKEGIPVILVNGNKVPDVVKNFLNKYKISNAIIVGGDKAVGKDVEKLFKSVDRVAGADRYETSKKIAEKFFAGSKTVFVASGESFADSLSVSYYAGDKNAPILLTKANSLDNDTKEYLEKNKNKDYIIVGGDKAINPDLFK